MRLFNISILAMGLLSIGCASTLSKLTTASSNGGIPTQDVVKLSESISKMRLAKPSSPEQAKYEAVTLEEGKKCIIPLELW